MYTSNRFADVFGVDPVVAYGFLRFLTETGCCTTSRAEKVAGRKGKPATLYHLNPECIEKLSALLTQRLTGPAPAVLQTLPDGSLVDGAGRPVAIAAALAEVPVPVAVDAQPAV